MQNQKHKSRINNTDSFLMVGAGAFFDFLSIIPVINWIAAIFAWLTFGTWFMIKGVGFVNPKRFAVWGVSAIIGVVPAVSALPELTLAVAITIAMVRAEDQLGIKVPSPTKGKVLRGGRSKTAKIRRRMSQTPEKRRAVAERYQRIQGVRKRREAFSAEKSRSVDGVIRKPAWQN